VTLESTATILNARDSLRSSTRPLALWDSASIQSVGAPSRVLSWQVDCIQFSTRGENACGMGREDELSG
jgi:hypothetical protein